METSASNTPLAFERAKHPMDMLFKQRPDASHLPRAGDMVEGDVLEKRGSRLFVDLGRRGTGIVFGREYYAAADIIKRLAPGERITAKVVEPDNEEGYVELSLKEAGREKTWQELSRLRDTGELIGVKVLEANRGGLILDHLGVSGFLPASQLSAEHYPRVEGGDKEKIFEELKKLVGTALEVSVMDVDPAGDKLIFSEKTKETAAVREKLAAYHVGDVITGTVAGIVSFGAFVKFGDNLEGLVHISEIDWQLIQNPADVLKVGQAVEAKIIGIEGDKVSLSLKALKPDPWATAGERYPAGAIVTGTVVKFNPFGAFVKLDSDIQGLAHLSEFGSETKMREVLQLNQPHEFRVLSVGMPEHRLALGLPDRPASPELQRGEPAGLRKDESQESAAPAPPPVPAVTEPLPEASE